MLRASHTTTKHCTALHCNLNVLHCTAKYFLLYYITSHYLHSRKSALTVLYCNQIDYLLKDLKINLLQVCQPFNFNFWFLLSLRLRTLLVSCLCSTHPYQLQTHQESLKLETTVNYWEQRKRRWVKTLLIHFSEASFPPFYLYIFFFFFTLSFCPIVVWRNSLR